MASSSTTRFTYGAENQLNKDRKRKIIITQWKDKSWKKKINEPLEDSNRLTTRPDSIKDLIKVLIESFPKQESAKGRTEKLCLSPDIKADVYFV